MKKVFIFLTAIILVAHSSYAAVMSSSNYSIQSDSVNFGGGLSNSTNYRQESTAGEIATGESASANYNIKAGYQQMVSTYVAIGAVSNVSLSPSIDTTGGGTANGSALVTVTTDNLAGYELYIEASSTPALVSGSNFFTDYTRSVTSDPDYDFLISSTVSEFGFSPEGSHVVSEYKDNGSACNTGALETSDKCWGGLSTTDELIARSTSANNPTGTLTTIKFRAESGASNTQPAGTYTATTTVTATAL